MAVCDGYAAAAVQRLLRQDGSPIRPAPLSPDCNIRGTRRNRGPAAGPPLRSACAKLSSAGATIGYRARQPGPGMAQALWTVQTTSASRERIAKAQVR